MLTFKEYQERCADTDLGVVGGREYLKPEWMYYVLGISGESGELIERIKKLFRDGGGWYIENEELDGIIKEMGDITWYMARLCTKLNIDFEDVFQTNLDKLQSRMERNKLQGDGDNR